MRHLPNLISLLRIALVWPIASALEAGNHLTSLALFMIAGLSDGVDGYLAKHFGWTSELGKFLDPLADKLLLVTVFAEGAWLGFVPWWLTAAVVARDVFIGLGAMVFRLWFGPLHGHPIVSSKINTAAQLLYLFASMVNLAFRILPHAVLAALCFLALTTTAVSGINYLILFTRRAVRAPLLRS